MQIVHTSDMFDIRKTYISSVYGETPLPITREGVIGDEFYINRKERSISEEKKGNQTYKYIFDEQGIKRIPLSDYEKNNFSVSNEELMDIYRSAVKLEKFFGSPLEIEFGIELNGNIIAFEKRNLNLDSIVLDNNIEDITLTLTNLKRNNINTVYLNSENKTRHTLSAKILREEGFIVKSL